MTHKNKILHCFCFFFFFVVVVVSLSLSLSLTLSLSLALSVCVCVCLCCSAAEGPAFSAMGTGGALLLCALLYLSSTVHPACSCPEISRVDCTGHEADTGWQPCWNHLFRCRNHRLEIKFGGREPPFKVIGRGQMDGLQLRLKVEDPPLNSVFAKTDCDFLYTFPQPGPLFHPPPLPTSTPSFPPPHDLQSFCKEYDYTGLFSKLMKGYQAGRCTTYDLYCRSKGLKEYSEDPALRNRCLPPDPAASPVLIWELSLENNTSETNMVSVGFSSRHLLDQSCFNCSVTSARCDSASAGSYTRGKKRARLPLWEGLTIGFSAAGGASILASLLLCIWCRRKMKKTPSSSTLLSQPASLETAPEKDLEEVVSINYPTHVFRYQELHEASDGFSRANEVDHGGHGAVYKGTLPDGRTVAIKRLYENSFKRAELFMNEIAILSGLRHPNLVRLYGCTSRHSRELLLVYEFIPNGTIADHVHGHRAAEGALTWPLRLRIAVETATALAYLHAIEPPIIHRDVKTKNILLDGDFHVKVADFGLSRLFPVAASHVSTVPQGTPGYVDPEYHRCYQLTDKSDVYSFGVVLAELISSKTAVDVTRIRHEINLSSMALAKIQGAALQELVDPKLGFETDSAVRRSIELVAELAMRCLQGDRDTRPTMDDVLGILRGIEDGLHQAEGEREVDHTAGDGMGLQKNCTAASPNSVIGKWSSTATTPDASG